MNRINPRSKRRRRNIPLFRIFVLPPIAPSPPAPLPPRTGRGGGKRRPTARQPGFSLDVLTYGDGIGCDSLYLTQAGHRVTYCDLGELSQRFAQTLFDAVGLPFAPTDDLSALPVEAFDVVVCLDVLEHVPDPP